ncbi:hypothetical protein NST77_25875 [Niallia sp. FSL W8-0177]|uniref:hypothetical protein n=1 Tax=Niallia sp. FSL W8-0177 TaxID=2954522 RepID=UPI0030F63814
MSQELIGKHIRFNPIHIDIMDDLIKNQPGVNNNAEAVRFALLSLKDPITNDDDVKRKINSMAKQIDILTEMVAGGFHEQGVNVVGKSEDTYIYEDAKKNVEKKIQRSITLKSNPKRSQTNDQKENRHSRFFD